MNHKYIMLLGGKFVFSIGSCEYVIMITTTYIERYKNRSEKKLYQIQKRNTF